MTLLADPASRRPTTCPRPRRPPALRLLESAIDRGDLDSADTAVTVLTSVLPPSDLGPALTDVVLPRLSAAAHWQTSSLSSFPHRAKHRSRPRWPRGLGCRKSPATRTGASPGSWTEPARPISSGRAIPVPTWPRSCTDRAPRDPSTRTSSSPPCRWSSGQVWPRSCSTDDPFDRASLGPPGPAPHRRVVDAAGCSRPGALRLEPPPGPCPRPRSASPPRPTTRLLVRSRSPATFVLGFRATQGQVARPYGRAGAVYHRTARRRRVPRRAGRTPSRSSRHGVVRSGEPQGRPDQPARRLRLGHPDAHLAKYTVACLDAASADPEATRLSWPPRPTSVRGGAELPSDDPLLA